MKNTQRLIFVVGILVFVCAHADAQMPGAGNKPERGKFREDFFKELNLTAEQQKKLEENRNMQRKSAQEMRVLRMNKENELHQALKNPSVTRVEVEPIINEIKIAQARMIDQRIDGIFAVRTILTPEQIAQFEQIMEKRKTERKAKGRFSEWNKKDNNGENE